MVLVFLSSVRFVFDILFSLFGLLLCIALGNWHCYVTTVLLSCCYDLQPLPPQCCLRISISNVGLVNSYIY